MNDSSVVTLTMHGNVDAVRCTVYIAIYSFVYSQNTKYRGIIITIIIGLRSMD